MPRQLNLRVNEEFARRLESLARRLERPMAAVLEEIGMPAIEAMESDLQFEAEAFSAWEEYQLTGEHVSAEGIDAIFAEGRKRARAVTEKSAK